MSSNFVLFFNNGFTEYLRRYLYAQFLVVDANFRLKQKDRGFGETASLGPGWGYFVEPDALAAELRRVEKIKQPAEVRISSAIYYNLINFGQRRTCDSSFAAIERANSRVNQGFSVTGVVGVMDSRHGVVLANSIADLQRGER